MPQAIVTKYLGPTDHKGARVKARCQAGSVIVGWDSDVDANDNHNQAVSVLTHRLGWDKWRGRWIGGDMPNSEKSHRCYVFIGRITWD